MPGRRVLEQFVASLPADLTNEQAVELLERTFGGAPDAAVSPSEIPAPDTSRSFGEKVARAALNVPSSAADLALGAVQGIPEIGRMSVQAASGDLSFIPQALRAFKDQFVERYGSLDKAAETLQTDPVGALADLSLGLTGIGGIARAPAAVGRATRGARALGAAQKGEQIGAALQAAGRATDPFRQAVRPGALALKDLGARVTGRAIGPSGVLQREFGGHQGPGTVARKAFGRTALEEGVLTAKRAEKVQKRLGRQIGEAARAADTKVPPPTIRTRPIVAEATRAARFGLPEDPFSPKAAENQIFGRREALADIARARTEAISTLPPRVGVRKALAGKRATERQLHAFLRAEERGSKVPEHRMEAMRGVAAGLGRETAELVPALKELNPRFRNVVGLRKALAAREASPASMIPPLFTGTLAGAGGIGVGAGTGNITAGLATALALGMGIKALTAPRSVASMGRLSFKAGKFAEKTAPAGRLAALLQEQLSLAPDPDLESGVPLEVLEALRARAPR